MVARVRAALNIRFPGRVAPRRVFTDRGNSFFNASTDRITYEYDTALKAYGLQAFFGDAASIELRQLQEIVLHETTLSWMRLRLAKTLPSKAWKETLEAYRLRLKECAAYINAHHDVEGRCRDLPNRLAELDRRKGDRLAK